MIPVNAFRARQKAIPNRCSAFPEVPDALSRNQNMPD
ncbi:MAG: hypothetical protein BWX67_00614 [Thermotogae bacterium ADurb.Bin062]|nr:MAG: hypothetical protein BWX67_00614 [Thermotogota bacterium ADurb.Bin062]